MEKTVIITGASRGIGKELARVFAKNGFNLSLGSRNLEALKKVKEEIEASYKVRVNIKKTDVSNQEECRELIEETRSVFGSIDVLINNAGVGIYAPIEDIGEEELRKVFDVNFFGSFYCIKYSLPFLKDSKGSIINISSVAGLIPVPFMTGYSASKFALNALSEGMRAELKKYGIHVLLVCPGVIKTGFTNNAFGNYKPRFKLKGAKAYKLADKVFEYYKAKKKLLIYPGYYRIMIWAYKMMPSLYNYISIRMWKKKDIY